MIIDILILIFIGGVLFFVFAGNVKCILTDKSHIKRQEQTIKEQQDEG